MEDSISTPRSRSPEGNWKKFCTAVVLSWLLLAQVAKANAVGGFISRRGNQFVDSTGRPFMVHGCNVYWLMYQGADRSSRGMVDAVFRDAKSLGLNVGRTWAFNDGAHDRALQTSPGVYDENVFKGLDYGIAQAQKNGMRMVLSLVNNWNDYGGRQQYVQWARNTGANLPSDDNFYTDPTVRSYYKNHVKKVLTRVNSITGVVYKDDPTIFSWELINEPRCQSDPSGNTLAVWLEEMANYVKSIDNKHLLEIGMEGFYGHSTWNRTWANPTQLDGLGTDFMRFNRIDAIDYASVHSYPDLWLPQLSSAEKLTFLQIWVNIHIQDTTNMLGKPVLFTEFGKLDQTPSYEPKQRRDVYWTVYNSVFSSAEKGGAGGGSILWQLLPNGMESWSDGFAIFASDRDLANVLQLQSQRLLNLRASDRSLGSVLTPQSQSRSINVLPSVHSPSTTFSTTLLSTGVASNHVPQTSCSTAGPSTTSSCDGAGQTTYSTTKPLTASASEHAAETAFATMVPPTASSSNKVTADTCPTTPPSTPSAPSTCSVADI